MAADRVFTNAKVYSVAFDGTETRAEAVAVKDGKIVYVGSAKGVEEFICKDTVVTDCKGNSILPGFGDAHMHFGCSVRRFGAVFVGDLATAESTPDDIAALMKQKLAQYAEEHPNDKVIHGMGWAREWFDGSTKGIKRPFTRHDIDEVISDRPVALDSVCGHALLVNTKALELAGYDKNTPDPPSGVMGREADGTPDGYFQEAEAIQPMLAAIPNYPYTDEQHRAAMHTVQNLLLSRGYTFVCDMMTDYSAYDTLKDMAEKGDLKLRLQGVFHMRVQTVEEDYAKALENRHKYDVDDIMRINTIKYFEDGSLAMIDPYTDAYCDSNGLPRGYKSEPLWSDELLKNSFVRARKDGFNIHVHAMGDYGAQKTIDCMIEAQKYDPEHKCRDAIAHCSFVTQEDIRRMGEHNIIASIQPLWEGITDTSDPAITYMFGENALKRVYPNKSFVDAGVVCAYGSDFPVNPADALSGIQVAMTRDLVEGTPLYDRCKGSVPVTLHEAVSLKEAVRAHTINVAYQFNMDDVTGSIEVGKSAELVLLDKDIENVPAKEISKIQVKETLFKGKTVFKAE